jgi:hypothetical protein
MSKKDLNEAEAKIKVAALFISDDATRRRIICGLVGHSRIVRENNGSLLCGRCDKENPGVSPHDAVMLEHLDGGCSHCDVNLRSLTWKDTWEAPPLEQTDRRI